FANRADLAISLSSGEAGEIGEYFQVIQKELSILPVKDQVLPESRKAERRRYFAAEPIDKAWFERCVALVKSLPEGKFSFQGRCRLSGHEGEDFSRTNYEAWVLQIASQWDKLTWVYCWLSAPELAITLDIDLLRDLISVDLQSPIEAVVTSTFKTLEAGLNVIQVKGYPYRYRFLRTFKIERWTTNEAYAD